MESISDVQSMGGGGALVGWVFLLIFLIGGWLYDNTTSAQRYHIKNYLWAVFMLLAIFAGIVEIFTYILG